MSKFLEIEITRKVGTTIYVEVPDNFDTTADIQKINLKLASDETVPAEEWDPEPETFQICSVKEVPASVAENYQVHVH